MNTIKTFDQWWDEVENFSTRGERLFEMFGKVGLAQVAYDEGVAAALATQPQAPQGAVTDKSHIVVTKTTDGAIVAVTRQDDEGRITEIIAQDTQKPVGEKIGGKCQRILREEGVPYPRTCQVCGLGKCHYSSPAAPKTPEVRE